MAFNHYVLQETYEAILWSNRNIFDETLVERFLKHSLRPKANAQNSLSLKARIHYTKFYRKSLDNIYSPKSTKHLLNDGEFVARCRYLIHAAPDLKTF